MKVTVVTITYNSSRYVRQAIESVLAQSYKAFEYIIADDGSTDNTWDIIREYKDPRIRAWRNEMNIGEYPNRNKTLHEAKGEFVIWIDGDDILYKNALQEYINYIQAFPDARAIWGVHSLFFEFVVFPYIFTPKELTKINFLSNYPVTSIGFTDSLFHTKALQRMGGFDERYAIGDTYVKRNFAARYPVLLVPAGRAFWRRPAKQASKRAEENHRNLIEMLKMDEELLNADCLPLDPNEKAWAVDNYKIRRVKLIARNSLYKAKFLKFYNLLKETGAPFSDVRKLIQKGNYSYKMEANGENPIYNNYNFTSE